MNRLSALPWQSLPAWLAGNRLRILMYHSISENQRDPHAISPSEFKRQLQSLQSGQVVSLAEGLERLRTQQSLKNTWAITFDDGLLDFYTDALPLLREFSYPVTMFIPTGLVGKTAIWDSYDKSKPLLSWRQMEDCQRWNVTFGSHTIHHVRLTECTNTTLNDELKTSLRSLHENLQRVIEALAYPGGYYNAGICQAAKDAGYVCAVGAASRWGNGAEIEPLSTPS